jgi:hypothetical protein
MAEEHLNTSGFNTTTTFFLLSDAITLTRGRIEDFIEILDEESRGDEVDRVVRILKELLKAQDQDLDEIFRAIDRTVGDIDLESPLSGVSVEFEGRFYKCGQFFRARLNPVKPQPPAQGGEA